MLLYHGTCASNLDRILKSGIKPRSLTKRKGNFGHTLQGQFVTASIITRVKL